MSVSIKDFPEELRKLALYRAMQDNPGAKEYSLLHCTVMVFEWSATPEGYDFWNDVHSTDTIHLGTILVPQWQSPESAYTIF